LFRNGRTATEGFSGNLKTGRSGLFNDGGLCIPTSL
jgi:hypothetical protein